MSHMYKLPLDATKSLLLALVGKAGDFPDKAVFLVQHDDPVLSGVHNIQTAVRPEGEIRRPGKGDPHGLRIEILAGDKGRGRMNVFLRTRRRGIGIAVIRGKGTGLKGQERRHHQ